MECTTGYSAEVGADLRALTLVTSLIHEALDGLASDEFSEEQKSHIASLAKELEEVY